MDYSGYTAARLSFELRAQAGKPHPALDMAAATALEMQAGTADGIENAIVEFARENDCLPELCNFVDYHPDIGRVQEHWEPKPWVLLLAKRLAAR